MKHIRKIDALETFSVRQPVLRPGKPVESCHFDGDDLETTTHFGLFLHNDLIGVISIFEHKNSLFSQEKQFQIRGMAVLEHHQKKGFGADLVYYAENYIKDQNGKLIWFNARITAVAFYEKLGYLIVGDAFEIADIGKHFVLYKPL